MSHTLTHIYTHTHHYRLHKIRFKCAHGLQEHQTPTERILPENSVCSRYCLILWCVALLCFAVHFFSSSLVCLFFECENKQSYYIFPNTCCAEHTHTYGHKAWALFKKKHAHQYKHTQHTHLMWSRAFTLASIRFSTGICLYRCFNFCWRLLVSQESVFSLLFISFCCCCFFVFRCHQSRHKQKWIFSCQTIAVEHGWTGKSIKKNKLNFVSYHIISVHFHLLWLFFLLFLLHFNVIFFFSSSSIFCMSINRKTFLRSRPVYLCAIWNFFPTLRMSWLIVSCMIC